MRSSRVARVVIGSDLKSDGYGRASSNLVSDVPIFFFWVASPQKRGIVMMSLTLTPFYRTVTLFLP